MKYFLLIVVFIVQISCSYSQTSTYHPFPLANNAIWRVDAFNTPCNQYHPTSLYQYTTGADTTIGNFSYKKVYASGMQFCEVPTYIDNIYVGAIREDTTNRKVFFSFPGFADTLLYDFNLEVGDTMRTLWTALEAEPISYEYIITSIDSVLINSSYHKRFNTAHSSFSVIEGIGGTTGLIEPLMQFIDGGFYLTCFSSDLYNYPEDTSSCPLIGNTVGIKAPLFTENNILIIPNPIENEGVIEWREQTKIEKIEIYNARGLLIMSQSHLSSNRFKIAKNNLTSGVYVAKLVSESQKCTTIKFIVY